MSYFIRLLRIWFVTFASSRMLVSFGMGEWWALLLALPLVVGFLALEEEAEGNLFYFDIL